MNTHLSYLFCAVLMMPMVLWAQDDSTTKEGWQGYTNQEFGYAISFPSEPTANNQQIPSEIGPLQLNIYMLDLSEKPDVINMVYLVNATDYPEDMIHSDNTDRLDGFYEGAINGAVTNVNGELISEKTIELEGYEGREIKINFGNGMAIISAQIFLVNNRMYMVQTICETAKDGNRESKQFFESFRLLE